MTKISIYVVGAVASGKSQIIERITPILKEEFSGTEIDITTIQGNADEIRITGGKGIHAVLEHKQMAQGSDKTFQEGVTDWHEQLVSSRQNQQKQRDELELELGKELERIFKISHEDSMTLATTIGDLVTNG